MTQKHHETKETITKSDKMLYMELADSLKRPIDQQVIDALVENERVRAKAAKSMGISRQLMSKWIKMLSIDISRITPEKHSQWANENYEELKQFR